MATVTLSSYLVFPTENDVNGGTTGAGRVGSEYRRATLQDALGMQVNRVYSGFTLPSSGALASSVAAGEAIIDGYLIKGSASISVTFTASVTNYTFIQLVYSGGIVTTAQLVTQTSITPPANSVFLGAVVTGGSTISSASDYRPQGLSMYGRCNGGGSGNTISDYGSTGWTLAHASGGGTTTLTFTLPSGFFRKPNVIFTCDDMTKSMKLAINSATEFVITMPDAQWVSSADFISWVAYL